MRSGIIKRTKNLFLSGSIQQLLIVPCSFSLLLLFIRILFTGTMTYAFLPWNLFLAFIPLWVSHWLFKNFSLVKWYKLIPALMGWILFLPNSFYLITDLFHLTYNTTVPKWFDLLMIFSFAWNGILCGFLALNRMEQLFARLRLKNFSILIIFSILWLCAFGIYIGRYLRFNSWDVITDPLSLFSEIIYMVIHPFRNYHAWGMVCGYSVFITVLYFTIKKFGEGFKNPTP